MAKMNMIAALNSALAHQLERDPNVVIFGEESSVGLVRLRLGQTLPKLEALVADVYSRDSSIPLDIAANDISALLDED